MSMIIANNNMAVNTHRNMGKANSGLSKSIEKLSSGYRINVGADGPADLVISEQLRAQKVGLERAVKNTNEANNLIGIAEGALNEMSSILKTMKALAVHSASDGVTSPSQIAADQSELDSALKTLARIANTTKYSDQQLLNGSKELTYDTQTTVAGTQNNALVNQQLSKFDQIFKRAGFDVSLNYTGSSNANRSNSTGDVDWTKQANKAYLEIDTGFNSLSQVDRNGNLLQDQEFVLTGKKGTEQFKFGAGENITKVVQQIQTKSGVTGITAALTFSGDQRVDMLSTGAALGETAVTTTEYALASGSALSLAGGVYGGSAADSKAMVLQGLNVVGANTTNNAVMALEVDLSGLTDAAKEAMYGDPTLAGTTAAAAYRFNIAKDAATGKTELEVLYGDQDAVATQGKIDISNLMTLENGKSTITLTAEMLDAAGIDDGHLEGAKLTFKAINGQTGAAITDGSVTAFNANPPLEWEVENPTFTAITHDATPLFILDEAQNVLSGTGVTKVAANVGSAEHGSAGTTNATVQMGATIKIDSDTLSALIKADPETFGDITAANTKYDVQVWANASGGLTLGLMAANESDYTKAIATQDIAAGAFSTLGSTGGALTGTATLANGLFKGSTITVASSATNWDFGSADGTVTAEFGEALTAALDELDVADGGAMVELSGDTVLFTNQAAADAVKPMIVDADGTEIDDADGLFANLSEEVRSLMQEGDNTLSLRFAQRTGGVEGETVNGMQLFVGDTAVKGTFIDLADDALIADFFGAGNLVDLGALFGDLRGLYMKNDVNPAAGATWGELQWDDAANGVFNNNNENILSFELNATVGVVAGVPSADMLINIDKSQVTRMVETGVGSATGGADSPRALGGYQVFGNQSTAITSATGTVQTSFTNTDGTVTTANGVKFGYNTDGQGRVYVKFTSDTTYELYKDESLSAESLIGQGESGKAVTAMNNSGLQGLTLTLNANTTNAKGESIDIRTVKGAYIAFGGIQGTSTYADAGGNNRAGVVYEGNLTGGGDIPTTDGLAFDATRTLLTGVELSANTDKEGQIHTKTEVRSEGGVMQVRVSAYRDANLEDKNLVAQSEWTALGATEGTNVVLNEIRNADNTKGTGLGISLTVMQTADELAGIAPTTSTSAIKGTIKFQNLAARIYTEDYGSAETLTIQQKKGGLFTYYQTSGDLSSNTLIEAKGGVATTVDLTGQDATLSINGGQVKTAGLNLNLASTDITARLSFNGGKVGSTTLAQVGYGAGSIFTKIGALELGDAGDITTAQAQNLYANMQYLNGMLCNASHNTTETITNFQGGMQLQLGEGSGDQERTIISVQSMNLHNLGLTEFTDQWDSGKAITETRTLSLDDLQSGKSADLSNDPIKAMAIIEKAIDDVANLRAQLGAVQANMLTTNANNLEVAIENIQKTESAIRDTDMASEMTTFTKYQVLQSASISMLAQANQQSQSVLQLLG